MQQTLLALVAMLIATLLSFSQQQAAIQQQQQVVRAEVQQMALSVAQQSMEVIQARAFDAATEDLSSDETIDDPAKFSSAPFTSNNDCEAFGGSDECGDVDDFHEMKTATVSYPLPGGRQFDFSVDVRLRYVNKDLKCTHDDCTSGPKSFRKEVTIFVQDIPSGEESRLSQPIEYSEVVSYP